MKNLFTAIALALVASPAWAITGQEIVAKVQAHPSPKSSAVQLKMTLIDNRRSTPDVQERMATIIAKETETGGLSRLRFASPKDIKGVGLLVVARDEGENDQWLYMPALGKSTRIAGAQKKGSFMGTDFTFEDLEPRNPDSGEHTLLREEKLGEHDVWVVESRAKNPKDSSYSKIIQWVRQDIAIPVQAEFYDRSERLLKVLVATDIHKEGAYWIAGKTTMENVRKKHKTIMEVVNQKNDLELPDSEFTQRALTK